MRYMLLIYGNEDAMQAAPKEAVTQMSAAYEVLHGGDEEGRRAPRRRASAADRRRDDGARSRTARPQVLNGPYAETKEQLGGYYMIEAPDLDAALSWASRCPGAAHGAIEVRPIWPMM